MRGPAGVSETICPRRGPLFHGTRILDSGRNVNVGSQPAQGRKHRHGDDIVITVVEIRGWDGKVRLGIEAPTEIPVHRMEVWQEIRREEEQAGRPPAALSPAIK
jgi:carbon storage regulator